MIIFLKNTGIVFISILISLALVEIMLRTFELAPTSGISTMNEKEFKDLPGIFSPGQNIIDKRIPQLPHYVSINSLGYRGSEFDINKGDNEFRIFMSGDSLTYGDFVDNDKTLPAQLERLLQEDCKHTLVVNGGMGGSSITEHIEIIKRAETLRPDLVILVFYENDIGDLSGKAMWQQLADNRKKKSRFPLSIIYPVVKDLAIWNFTLHIIRKVRITDNQVKTKNKIVNRNNVANKLRLKYKDNLVILNNYLQSNNISFLFTFYPSHKTYTLSSDHVLSRGSGNIGWIAATADELGIQAVNILPALKKVALDVTKFYLLPYDGHPSPQGYQIGASTLARKIIRGNYIPEHFCD